MSGGSVSESTVEAVAVDWLGSLDWAVLHGPDIAPDTPAAERADYGEVVLTNRLRVALARLNPDLPDDAIEDALRRLTRPVGATLEARNRDFHRMLVAGVTVEHVDTDDRVRGAQVRVVDFGEPSSNDWLAVNQFTVVENKHERRPDIVLFVNGLPLAVIELKNPADENATIWSAFHQLSDLQGRDPLAVYLQRGARRVGRTGSAHRSVVGRAGMVQALAHDRGRETGRLKPPATPSAARRRLQSAPAAGIGPRLHCVRGRRQRRPRQEDGRLPPVPRGANRRRRDAAGGGLATGGRGTRSAGPLRVGAASRAAPKATGGSVWSGIPRGRARA